MRTVGPRQRKISTKGGITSSLLSITTSFFSSFLISFAHTAHWSPLILIILIFTPGLVAESSVWPWCVTLGGRCCIHKRQCAPWTRDHQLKYIVVPGYLRVGSRTPLQIHKLMDAQVPYIEQHSICR